MPSRNWFNGKLDLDLAIVFTSLFYQFTIFCSRFQVLVVYSLVKYVLFSSVF